MAEEKLDDAFKAYLAQVAPNFLQCGADCFSSGLSDGENSTALNKFLSDSEISALTVEKTNDGSIKFSSAAKRSAVDSVSIAFIKTAPVPDASEPMAGQFHICQMDDKQPMSSLLSYVRDCFIPYSRSMIDDTLSGNTNAIRMGINGKLRELEVELMRSGQSALPRVTLSVHPDIAAFVAKKGARAKVTDFDKVSDAALLKAISKNLDVWKKDIVEITKRTRSIDEGSTVDEINFWLGMEKAVMQIYQEKQSPGVDMTFKILRHNKRFLPITSFEDGLGLAKKKEKDRVYRYSKLLRDLPIKKLLSSTNIPQAQDAVGAIFQHLHKIKSIEYPLARAVKLVHAISKDLVATLQAVINARRPMYMKYSEFEKITQTSEQLFARWDDLLLNFKDEIRDLQRSRPGNEDTGIAKEYHLELITFRSRLTDLRDLRRTHEELRSLVEDTLTADPEIRESSLVKVNEAYGFLQQVDVLGITKELTDAYDANRKKYKDKIDSVEGDLEKKIETILEAAKDDASEMFRICAKYHRLFSRPRIQGTIRKYQDPLINTVKKDIHQLEKKFKRSYKHSHDKTLSTMRGLPEVSGAIIWAKQIENQLDSYLNRVESVLGKGWIQHVEGRRLKRESDLFRENLQPIQIFSNWIDDNKALKRDSSGKIYRIEEDMKTGQPYLVVNFDQRMITLFKEVRNLKRLGEDVFHVPYELSMMADDAKEKYPFAMRLGEVIRTYKRTGNTLEKVPELASLAAGSRDRVQRLIEKGLFKKWDETSSLKRYVEELGSEAVKYQDQVDEMLNYAGKVNANIAKLGTCHAAAEDFREIIDQLQNVVTALEEKKFSNLGGWVSEIDGKVESILIKRLEEMLGLWVKAMDIELVTEEAEFDIDAALQESKEAEDAENDKVSDVMKRECLPFVIKEPIRLAITIRNQILQVDPPLEEARQQLTKNVQKWIGVVAELPRLNCSDFSNEKFFSYRSGLGKLDPMCVQKCVEKMNEKMGMAQKYVDTWMKYQTLWDLSIENVEQKLSGDMNKWKKLVMDVKKSRASFNIGAAEERFGPVLIDFKSVQNKVNNKYKAWQSMIVTRFGNLLGTNVTKLYGALKNGRSKLEKYDFDFGTTNKILNSVTLLKELNKKEKAWKAEYETYSDIEKLLREENFEPPKDWIGTDVVGGEMDGFEQILNRKLFVMFEQRADIQKKIEAEYDQLELRIKSMVENWDKNKPTDPSMEYHECMESLGKFDAELEKLDEDVIAMRKAQDALEIKTQDEVRLKPIREEIDELKAVWKVLGKSWQDLEKLGMQKFRTCKMKDLRRDLGKLESDLQRMPRSMRQYSGFETLKAKVKTYKQLCPAIAELAGGTLRDKHQKQILKVLQIPKKWGDLQIGDFWAADLKRHQKQVRYILEQAQGEGALEEFLQEVSSGWLERKFDLVDYRGKCFLNRNWDDIFEQLASNLGDLQSMKNSPFYGAFEAEAVRWETTLNDAQAIFDIFIEVQRRWVYLEGIFNNSQEVQMQLPYQYKKFKGFDKDFIKLMREIHREQQCDYWVKRERGLLQKMENYIELLQAIQKALSDYLEKQRGKFPRFFFVGDDDLLEIIGSAKDVNKILRHIAKMFAGITSLGLGAEDGSNPLLITAFTSKEGEVVPLKGPIDVSKKESIHEWLTELEFQMRFTLAALLTDSIAEMEGFSKGAEVEPQKFLKWVGRYPAQVCMLSIQVYWSESIEKELMGKKSPSMVFNRCKFMLNTLANNILTPGLPTALRRKYEQLITELVHQRDVCDILVQKNINCASDYNWLQYLRYYFTMKPKSVEGAPMTGDPGGIKSQLVLCVSRANFYYGWEYQGVGERLVTTPLTDRCYLTLCEALHMKMGANPYGPAGTGKTESVKSLGNQLGRFVLVFNCDENFDFQSMGRIFVGLCQCGAWGCFDEFNRLEEAILSAVSQQILTIQQGLNASKPEIELLNKNVKLNGNMGIFVTMNPGYAGRSALPDNLKQLFRAMAMTKPDSQLIAQVMLYSQGFATAKTVAGRVVSLFKLCKEQLSKQSHYDFGLRALKGVLRSCGNLKRKLLVKQELKKNPPPEEPKEEKKEEEDYDEEEKKDEIPEEEDPLILLDLSSEEGEEKILIKSICGTLVPKLVLSDINLFNTILLAVFPSATITAPHDENLIRKLREVAKKRNFEDDKGWMDKIMQLNAILKICHGVIMVGPAATGKTSSWECLREACQSVGAKRKIVVQVVDPKAITKADLYGTLDPTTLEWTDGIFTSIIRKIIGNVRNEQSMDHWVIFDGDVDPEWCENLNSVLDDNKLLTLPNGERLSLTPNIRVMFEVKNLDYATLATVSRCGMVWYSRNVISNEMLLANTYKRLQTERIHNLSHAVYNRHKPTQEACCASIKHFFIPTPSRDETSFLLDTIVHMQGKKLKEKHVMPYSPYRAMMSLLSMLKFAIAKVVEYNDNHMDFPLSGDRIETPMTKYIAYAALWGFCGDMPLEERLEVGEYLETITKVIPFPQQPLIDWEPRIDTGEWKKWEDRVTVKDLHAKFVIKPDCVIETTDTCRHVDVIGSWLADHRPLLLCGPPGSGKSMTLTSVLNAMPEFELITLNFSSSTDVELIMNTLSHYCETSKTPKGMVMRPSLQNKWLVIFCDEINLPRNDNYGTQAVITFLRQLQERKGFWRAADLCWVSVERIQIIGACNPPGDAGRVALTERFLRHCPLMFVDFPSKASLKQIYGTFCKALLKLQPPLRKDYWEPLTDAMVEVYTLSQKRFTADIQDHYIYSPRELSRWTRAMYGAMDPSTTPGGSISLTGDDLVRLWLHEALRLFSDRLVDWEEKEWTNELVNKVAKQFFKGIDEDTVLARPVLYSNWLTKEYVSVDQEELREHVKLRLDTFRQEELDIHLVIFDEVLEHILRIDRVLRQPLGHLLLVGASGSGKTVLSKFVSWMNGMSVFQIKVHKNYKPEDFDCDLRGLLTRSGCHKEKIAFIFDESNVLDSAFLERMNSLLASGEVPGLFEGADWTALMEECKMASARENLGLSKEDELYKYFCREIQRNLHVIFTMNPSNEDFDNRNATAPALYNRCVIDWFGEWSSTALYQVGHEFTLKLQLSDLPDGEVDENLEDIDYDSDDEVKKPMLMGSGTERDNVVSTLVYIHESVYKAMVMLARNTGKRTYVTPRHYLDFIKQYSQLSKTKREELEEGKMHLSKGLKKLIETKEEVAKMKIELQAKEIELANKEKAAAEKLDMITEDQANAIRKRDTSMELKETIEKESVIANDRQTKIAAALADAEPALRAAEAAVKGIKKKDLDQIRSYANPPPAVKTALQPIAILLGVKKYDDWKSIKKMVSNKAFKQNILDFNVDTVTKKKSASIQNKFYSLDIYNFEKINGASKACGPLFKWTKSMIKFAAVKNSVAPLEAQMKLLTDKLEGFRVKLIELTQIREELEQKIVNLKEEYAELMNEAEITKKEAEEVQSKVSRSESLLSNLASEEERWSRDEIVFEDNLNTVVGDCLVTAAYLAYIGFFNQTYREMLKNKWIKRCAEKKIRHTPNLEITQYVSNPSEQLEWHGHGLPRDIICVENAIMMKNFNRYPLIIDPSGQATEFLMAQYKKERKIQRTSFLSDDFLKRLETALRFGNALLVEDVESIDATVNSVLNKEIFKQGGRIMITLGDKEIDFSPSFVIFMSTRDPNCFFTPDLCSRVTFVNFTVTHDSLVTQSLTKVLSAERPDIDKKRSDLMKLQGEFRVRLRLLEDKLLDCLSNVQGDILSDDTVIGVLEGLKKEAAEIAQKLEESEVVQDEVKEVENHYRPFASAASSIYFSLESLGNLDSSDAFLYQFSLPFFLKNIEKLLKEPSEELKNEKDPMKRYKLLSVELFNLSFSSTARGLMVEDKFAYACRLAQIALNDLSGDIGVFGGSKISLEEMDFLTKGSTKSQKQPGSYINKFSLTSKQKLELSNLLSLPNFSKLDNHLASNTAQWNTWMTNLSATAEQKSVCPIYGWESSDCPELVAFQHLLVVKILRPDLVSVAIKEFVLAVFGPNFLDCVATIDLNEIVKEKNSKDGIEPYLLVSLPGYDSSAQVELLVQSREMGDKFESYAMGSPEGYPVAERAIKNCAKEGKWLFLKNVHLSSKWLAKIERELQMMKKVNPVFTLFLSMELNDKVPSNLIRMSKVIIFEPPVGLKPALIRAYATLDAQKVNKAPACRARLQFLLTWLHSIILERLRYKPVGWTKGFEFGASDLRCGVNALDEWIDKSAVNGKLSPDNIPWDALQALFEKVLYGGRIDNPFDQARLTAFVKSVFVRESFNDGFPLCNAWDDKAKKLKPLIKIPNESSFEGFLKFIKSLPEAQSPELLGLPSNADVMLSTKFGEDLLHTVQICLLADHDTGDDDIGGDDDDSKQQKAGSSDKPEWMTILESSVQGWLQNIVPKPTTLPKLPGGAKLQKLVLDACFRCLQREYNVFRELLIKVHSDLTFSFAVLTNTADANNRSRSLFNFLKLEHLPHHWQKYGGTMLRTRTKAAIWLGDFKKRIATFEKLGAQEPINYGNDDIWLGAFIAPAAWIAATKQAVAARHGWSIQDLGLQVEVDSKGSRVDSFSFNGMRMFGAKWVNGALGIDNDDLSFKMPTITFKWKKKEELAKDKTLYAQVPIYLDNSRETFIWSVNLKRPKDVPSQVWDQRGVCLTVWEV